MSAGVVFAEERGQPLIEFAHRLVVADIGIIILHGVPETLDHDVVQGPALAIHADLNTTSLEHARELAALITVKDLGIPSASKASSKYSTQKDSSMLLLSL